MPNSKFGAVFCAVWRAVFRAALSFALGTTFRFGLCAVLPTAFHIHPRTVMRHAYARLCVSCCDMHILVSTRPKNNFILQNRRRPLLRKANDKGNPIRTTQKNIYIYLCSLIRCMIDISKSLNEGYMNFDVRATEIYVQNSSRFWCN